ncbi:IS256 family transposase [Mammaliicoccus sciuri]|uniref:IS256 family transposase n=1 Tax=Mammaliicoccus sciuri TaxID=1296 RepID=UPI002DB744E8|nr:IS256 family transposase [Mammaliicoccus sciuri]MEB8132627.1 transposase [Mammaliicoccus sciuri]
MTQLNVNLDYEELASAIFGSDMNASMKTIAMTVINAYMEMERDKYVNAGYKQKNSGRNAQRNGYYERDFLMPIGNLTLKVPRTRDGKFTTEVFNQYSRSDQSLILAMTEAYINGVSTRNVNKIVSKGVYIAMGIKENRKHDIIGFKISNQESELAWSEFFEDLRMRGLTTPELIISDAHSGLIKSIKSQFIDSSWQRCTFHFLKNIVERFPKKNSKEARMLLKSIFQAPTYRHAVQIKDEFIAQYESNPKYVEAIKILDEGFEDASQFYRFPAQHHKNLRTTNSVENINMQLRKREKIVKTFPNLDSAFRLIGAVLMDIQERFDKSNRPFIA